VSGGNPGGSGLIIGVGGALDVLRAGTITSARGGAVV
jgi:hypothetical protein